MSSGDLLQMQSQQEAVMPGHATAQRLAKSFGCRLEARVGELGQAPGITLTGNQGLDHPSPGQAHDIGNDRVELDVGVLQRLLQA
jgi:hypothetical protein